MSTGVYKIEHKGSGRVYIGSTTHFERRWRIHLCLLRKGAHHSKPLQSAWDEYGEEAFVFEPLLICAKKHLLYFEQLLIDGYRSFMLGAGFNARREAGSQLGTKHTAEARAKIRAARARQTFSEETRAKFSAAHAGRKMPEWFGSFISLKKKGVALVKTTAAEAEEIKRRHAAGESYRKLAPEFGIHHGTVRRIVLGLTNPV